MKCSTNTDFNTITILLSTAILHVKKNMTRFWISKWLLQTKIQNKTPIVKNSSILGGLEWR